MEAFQSNFPTIFPEKFSNDTNQSCSSGDDGNEDILVVSLYSRLVSTA